jgi:LPXTG-motif cell wall-anchored protein
MATTRKGVVLVDKQIAEVASQMRTAFSSKLPNTGRRTPGELLITLSTSAVAGLLLSRRR